MKKFNPRSALTFLKMSLVFAAGVFGLHLHAAPAPVADQVIEANLKQIGKRVAQAKSAEPKLDFTFESEANSTEFTVRITHRGVIQPWFVEVNGQRLGQLPPSYVRTEHAWFKVPAGALNKGPNTLSILSDDYGREISVGEVYLYRKSLRDLLKLRTVTVSVTDEETGKPMPARVSILQGDAQAEIFNVTATNVAIRPGLLYTDGKPVWLDISEGRYDFYATRGMEWSLGRESVSVSDAKESRVQLRIRRQVDTTGFIATDTHIHTLTFSGHGDATINERMLTIAGEGVEFAVATDHNHHTDYTRYQSRLNLNSYFTPATGNEVTTKNGHFIAFPMPLKGPVPDHTESDWVKLVADMRFKGAQAIIWNHPNWPSPERCPLTVFNFNRASGDRFNGPAFNFDAMELVNSSSPTTVGREDVTGTSPQLFAEWFAILNRGEKIFGVGASDTHTVEGPVGQGRTYIRSSTDDATRVNEDEMVRNFLAGDTSVSYGIFADVKVNGTHHMGEMIRAVDGKVDVNLHIASADWVKPRRAMVFLNGLPVAEKQLQPDTKKPFDQHVTFSVKIPKHDTHLVCAVFGDGISTPFWKTLGKFTAAVTNPLFVDGDGDGKYQSPRTTAEQLLAKTDGSLDAIWKTIETSDDALAGQMLGLMYLKRDADFVKQLDTRVNAAAGKRPLYKTFLANSPLIVVKTAAAK